MPGGKHSGGLMAAGLQVVRKSHEKMRHVS